MGGGGTVQAGMPITVGERGMQKYLFLIAVAKF